jgi:hypothetical protein
MHSIQAEIEVEVPGSNGQEYCYPVIEIVYNYSPGCPAVMYQRNGDPGWPAEPAEVEVMDVTLLEDGGLAEVDAKTLMKWAEDWIQDKGYYRACEEAELDHG